MLKSRRTTFSIPTCIQTFGTQSTLKALLHHFHGPVNAMLLQTAHAIYHEFALFTPPLPLYGSVVVVTVVRGGAKYVITKSKINARALMFCAGMNSEHNMHETTYNVGSNSSVMYITCRD